MKKSIAITGIFLMIFTTLEASAPSSLGESYVGYMWLIAGFTLLFLVYLLTRYKKELFAKSELLEQRDEKIQWLRQISAENDHRKTIKIQEMEKKILEMTHKIELLEQKAKEGTKNQVVAKIEELQNKRENFLYQKVEHQS